MLCIKVDGAEVITPGAWGLLHANPVCRPDAQFGMARTEFTQGGVNMYKVNVAYFDKKNWLHFSIVIDLCVLEYFFFLILQLFPVQCLT